MRTQIPLKTKLAITVSKLGSENILLACNAIYELIIGTTSIIVKECYTPIKTILKPSISKRKHKQK
jgi:hypothetical protein